MADNIRAALHGFAGELAQHTDMGVLASVASSCIYLALLGGLVLLLRGRFAALLAFVSARRRLSPRRAPGGKAQDPLLAHIERVLAVSTKRRVSATAFMGLSVSLFFGCFIVSSKTLPTAAAAITGFAFCGLPYLYLRSRLERLRRTGSFEGEKLMSAFLTNYLVAGGNIYAAIERVIESCPHLKVTTGLLRGTLATLRATGDPARIREAAERFSFGIGTSWSAMLAYVITTGAVNGSDMGPAIEDILRQLREARVLAEERKRINGESVRMAAYLTPALYVGSVLVAVAVMDVPPARFIHNQFFTPGGFSFFAVGLFLFLLNRVLLEIMTNKKLDF